jgi:HD-GYP domain-containing protein (c-di-GMP phosphodiesterase class II)
MIKKINTLALKVGMYVVQYGRGTPSDPFVFVERPILDLEDVRALVPRGVAEVMIDTEFDFEAYKAERAAEEARERAAAEARRKAEAEAKRTAEEKARQKAEAEARRKAEAEAKRKAEQETKRRAEEEARHKAEAEAKRKAEEEAKRKAEEEARRAAEQEAARQAEGARRRAEAEARRKEKAEAEAKRKAEQEAARQAEGARHKAEEEAGRRAEEEARRKAEEEARRQAEQEARHKAEAEAEQQAEAEARRKAEAEARRKAEEQEQALLRARDQARLKAEKAREKAAAETRRQAEAERRRAEAEAKARQEVLAALAAAEARPAKTWTVPLEQELPVAEKLYNEALDYTRSFIEDVRSGRPVDHKTAIPLVDEVIESVFRNDTAVASLCKLKRFDEYTYSHSLNVGVLVVVLGRRIGLAKSVLRHVGIAGLFHDVGKARIPKNILNKPGRLSPVELKVMRTHPIEGWHLMKDQKDLHPEALAAVLDHHERFDGKGYPRGLRGEEIGLFARLVGVVDVYDALTSQRVYKEPIPPGRALSLMYQWRLSDFFPGSVEHFIRCLGVFPVGSLVELTNGEHAVVMELNPAAPLRPKIRVVFDAQMRPKPARSLDLAEQKPQAGDKPVEIWRCLNPLDYKIDVVRLMG